MGAALAALAASAQAQLPGAAVDVLDYRFELALSDHGDEIAGRAVIGFRILRPVSEVEFDLDGPARDGPGADGEQHHLTPGADSAPEAGGRTGEVRQAEGMAVSSVTLANRALRFRQQDNRLVVALGREAATGEQPSVEIRYRGVPADGFTIGTNRHGERTFFADNWPDRAHHWLPVVDHPSDKALVAFVVTAPSHYQVVATGAFVEAVDMEGGMRVPSGAAGRRSLPR